MADILTFAIVGCGRHAAQKFLNIDSYIPGLRLVAVCDRNPDVLKAVGKMKNRVHLFADLDELLNSCAVDFIIIASDPASHYALAARCIESGIHILLEKPMTATLDEAERLRNIHDANPVKVLIGFHRRFGIPENKIRHSVTQGQLGDVLAIQVTHNFNDESRAAVTGYLGRGYESAGGVIYEYMSHEIDFLRFLFPGCTLDAPQVTSGHFLHPNDTAVVQLRVNNTIPASYLLCSSTTDYEEYRIFGTDGQLVFNRYRNTMPVYLSKKTLQNRPLRVLGEWWTGLNSFRVIKYGLKKYILQPYIDEVRYLMTCIRSDEHPVPSVTEGLFVMQTIDRMYSAADR